MIHDRLTAALEEKVPLVVLSPHLDDAVLSCGALLLCARERGTPVTVVTLFTEAGPPPHTLSARRFLRQTAAADAAQLYADRRAEDRAVLERLGVAWRHLGLPEALFRRRPRRHPPHRPRGPERLLPELWHLYPTYRLHITAGAVSPHDAGTLRHALRLVGEPAVRPVLLLAPQGVGGHVDHVLTRTVAEWTGLPVAYYSDFPYNREHRADAAFLGRHAFTATDWTRRLEDKPRLIRGYRTQADALFPDRTIPQVPERYLLPGGGM